MSDPFNTVAEDSFINELLDLYNNRKRRSMDPSPSSLFFLKEGARIVRLISSENGGGKPDYKKTFVRIRYEWTAIDEYSKIIYSKAAIKLGYKPKENFSDSKRQFVTQKIDGMKSKLGPLGVLF